jgi:hypothetical protein
MEGDYGSRPFNPCPCRLEVGIVLTTNYRLSAFTGTRARTGVYSAMTSINHSPVSLSYLSLNPQSWQFRSQDGSLIGSFTFDSS